MNPFAEEFRRRVQAYENTAAHNDRIHGEFTAATDADSLLVGHRGHVEEHRLGFGDRAFHAMWRLLLAEAHERFGNTDLLEIGVFKGQVVSLWALLARTYGWPVRIHAVTPFEGQPLPGFRWWRALQLRLNPRFRERVRSGDFYPEDGYEQIVRRLFARYELDFESVRWFRGYSNAPEVLAAVRDAAFQIIYIDGAHTYEAASATSPITPPRCRAADGL